MPDLERTIKGLECIISSGNAGMRDDCANCIYPGGGDCLAPALKDALALLKALDVTPEELERLKKCRHECKIDCLLEHYEKIKAERDALLKAQEPRVMTLEEVNALDWDYCYLEQERLPGREYRGMLGKYIMTCVTWPSITAAKISYGSDGYGKRWRCWTSRPTDAQREATPWK